MTTQGNNRIYDNYQKKAEDNQGSVLKRQMRSTIEINNFNNWIKSVLINVNTSDMCKRVEKSLDLKKGDTYTQLLHVLDIGCGRGQDIKKWKLGRVKYMLVNDFSTECLKQYQNRWRNMYEPYRLYSIAQDFTKKDLYFKIEHSYYDIVSAQFCFHYMFGDQGGLKNGLQSIFSNLLIGGVFIATIPDSYTILKKVKEKGIKNSEGHTIYGNKYFSVRFKSLNFKEPFGNQYGFYLQDAVGEKNQQTGEIQYVQEWLISLDHLQKMLAVQGMEIQETMNFLEYYKKYRQQYKDLFSKFKLNYEAGKHMDPDCWEIGHLYRVLVCRKVDKGKNMTDFSLVDRKKAAQKQIQRTRRYQGRGNYEGRDRSRNNGHHDSRSSHSHTRHHNNDRRGGGSRGGSYDNRRNYH